MATGLRALEGWMTAMVENMSTHLRLVLCAMAFAGSSGLASSLSATDGEVDLHVTPAVAQAPAHVSVVIRVPRAVGNRLLRVTLDSGSFYRSSDVSLDGDKAAVQHVLTWRGVAAGSYEVVAELHGSTDKKTIVRRPLQVLGFEPNQ